MTPKTDSELLHWLESNRASLACLTDDAGRAQGWWCHTEETAWAPGRTPRQAILNAVKMMGEAKR